MEFLPNESFVQLNCTEVEESSLPNQLQVGYQLISLTLGLPLNGACMWRLLKSLRAGDGRVMRLHLLLCASNILILTVHCGGYTAWLIGFWWVGDELICRLFAFLHAAVFYLSSNSLVAVALDLFCSVRFPLATLRNGQARVSLSILVSLMASLASALPQLFFWGLDQIRCEDSGVRRTQCSFIVRDGTLMAAYSIIHVVVLFWLPLGVIAPIYVSVCHEVIDHYRSNNEGWMEQQPNTQAPLRRSFGSGRRANASRRRIILTSLAIVTVYIVSWTPYQVSSIVQLIDTDALRDVLPLLQSLEALMILGAVVNPLLYRLADSRTNPQNSKMLPNAHGHRGSLMMDTNRLPRCQQTDLTELRLDLFG